MYLRRRRREAVVSLVLDKDEPAGLRHREINPADPHFRFSEVTPQPLASLNGERLRVFAFEGIRDLPAVLMDDRRHDVAGSVVIELDDIFAKVGLHRPESVFFEEAVEMNLLGRHRLCLDDCWSARSSSWRTTHRRKRK